jgi:hypothetical protein
MLILWEECSLLKHGRAARRLHWLRFDQFHARLVPTIQIALPFTVTAILGPGMWPSSVIRRCANPALDSASPAAAAEAVQRNRLRLNATALSLLL